MAQFHHWAWEMLHLIPPHQGQGGGNSELNNDGSPLQLSLSLGTDQNRVRLIVDPAWALGDPTKRWQCSASIFNSVLAERATGSLHPLRDSLFALAIPQDEQALQAFTRGFLWVGASFDSPGVAVYVDMQPHGLTGWEIAETWFADNLPSHPTQASLATLRQYTQLASLGFEGYDRETTTLKLYWRLKQPIPLQNLGIDLLVEPRLLTFLQQVIETRHMTLAGTVISTGFNLRTGKLDDVKVDLCAHCLPRTPDAWLQLLDRICVQNHYESIPETLRAALLAEEAHMAFLGFGVNDQTETRLNIYLRPYDQHARQITITNWRDALRQALGRAVDYLLDLQQPDGSWVDYDLPVGATTHWTTAFVGFALAEVRDDFVDAREAAENAAQYLLTSRRYEAGWGYNNLTGIDADSTGFALRLLRQLNYDIRPADEEALWLHWHDEGGFSTYLQDDHWGDVHPCVTACAMMAVPPSQQAYFRKQIDGYTKRFQLANHTWASYWWKTHHYSTYHHMVLLNQLGIPSIQPVLEMPTGNASAFEIIYALGITYLMRGFDEHARQLLARLLPLQRVGGGWLGDYNLRVTEPSCAKPWQQPEGHYYKDLYASITTASAVMVIGRILRNENAY